MSSDNNVVISPEVHKPRLELMKAPVGCTITEILRCAIREGKFDASDLPYVEIRINGKLLPRREDALDRCLLNNEIVQISMAVRGDNPLKNAFQLIVQVTAIVVGFYFGPWAAAAVQIAGGLATAALFRNKQDRLADPNSSSALNEQSNQIRRRAPMPLVLGKQRIGFDVAALSYTQNIGNDSWLNVIFGVHYGPCVVDDIKIGETLLRDYPASDYQIEYFLNPGPRNSNLYPGNVFQENFNNKLEFVGIPGGTWEVITPLPGAKGADVDFTLPAGLSYSTDKGKIRNEEVAGQIQIAEVGTENWQPAPFPGHDSARDKDNQLLPPGSWYLNMKTANAIRMTKSFALDPSKNWKIRVRAYDRDNDPSDHPGHTWDTYLTALRSKFDGRPIIDENLACIVLRIKASGDLGNTLPVVSGEVTPIVPVFKNGNWDTHEPSSNQAALLRWCLTDLPAARPLNQDQINSTCASVYNLIEARNWEAALHITEEISQEDLMRLCGLAGRFATYWSGEDLCFVGDWEKPIARQIFSAANIQGYKYRREFQDEIHAVLVEFKNVDQDSRADELWVYADGYDSTNATLFETYTLQYACKKDRAYREGRVYLARRELKTETHEWTCAFDSVTSTFGDRVRLSHYAALYGQDSGRVVNRIFSADKTMVIGIRVDFQVEQKVGVSYSVDVRRAEQAIVGILLEPVTELTASKNLYFAVPIAVASAPRKDDLVVFGETNLVTEDVEIDSFDPQSRTEVRISASPYVATQIEAAETGPIPSLPENLLPKPQVPRVRILQKYGKPEGVEVVFDIEVKDANLVRGFIARWRYSGEDFPWNTIGILPAEARTVRTPPIQRPAYDPDDPIDAVTRIDVQIVTLSMRGDYSQPATASNIEVRKEVQKLTGFDAIGVGRPAPDGSSKAAIAVIADPVTAGDIQYLDVEAAVLAQDAEYVSLGSLPASNPVGDFTEIEGGQDYVVRGRWRTQDNWYSDWEYVGLEGDPVHIPGGQNVANDTVNIGGRPVADVIAELATVGQLVNETAQAVQDLQDLYGDTASAAASAAAAAASEAAAIQAKADALIAAADAGAKAIVATNAKNAAETASASATDARDQALSSATTASGAAATATDQATLATNAKNDAEAASSAAVTAKNQASSFADAAGVSAAAAQSARVAAEAALGQMGASNLVARENISAGGAAVDLPAPSQSAWGFRLTGNDGNQTRTIVVGPLKTSTAYSVSFLARRTAGSGTTPINIDLYLNSALASTLRNLTGEWTRYVWENIQSTNVDMTSEALRLRFYRNPLATGVEYEITDIKLEEKATASGWSPSTRDAAFYAKSSAESASVATASQTAAESAASAATTAKTAAETARGQAQTAATQASSSRDDAAGSAASASSSALQAANSKDAAAGSASAAAGSASTANTKASEAGISAAAAAASQVSASTARDEAMLALMELGRTNIVARENVTPGSPVTPISPSQSGWGFTMTGTGSGVERGIVVGPLKQNTAYSVSFSARRSVGTGAASLSVDLYPDTLPERSFQIDENWTRFTWEGITSSHPDMLLANVRLRFFRSPLASGVQFEVTDIKLEEGATATAWTPSPKDAPASALAAATSASSANASETAAGVSANSASGSATQAATRAGEALTYRNQASSSAADAAGSAVSASASSGTAVTARDAAIGARNDAQGAAATAIAQASSASASAASAQISADLAASVTNSSGFNILKNSTFADGLTGWSTSVWAPSNPTAPVGPHAFTANNGTNNLTSDPFSINANFTYTLSADFRAQGATGNVVVDVQWLNSSGGHVAYSNRIFARVSDNVNFNQPRKSVTFTPAAGATQARVRVFTENVTGLSLNGAAVRQIKLEAGDKATTWRDDSQLVDINSSLKITALTTADLATRMATAAFEVTAAAGGNLAQLKIRADSTGSLAGLVAQAVSFANTINGSIVEVMKIIGGSVYITGKLFMGAAGQIELDPTYPLILWKFGNARLAIGQLPNDGLFFWFGSGGSTAITAMRKNNAKVWFDTNGNSYWGGSIVAGTISNSGQGSLITVPASFTLGPFGTNGGPITVVWSYDYSRTGKRWGNQTGGVTGQTTALVRFYRKIGSAAETLIDSMTVTGSFNSYYDAEPVPGQPSGTQGQTFFTEYMGGSRTYTDNAGGTQQRTYRVEVVTRSLRYVPGDSNQLDDQRQAYGITSSE